MPDSYGSIRLVRPRHYSNFIHKNYAYLQFGITTIPSSYTGYHMVAPSRLNNNPKNENRGKMEINALIIKVLKPYISDGLDAVYEGLLL